MAAAFAIPRIESAHHPSPRIATAETREQLEFAGVFRGRELTRKDRRLPSGLPLVDSLLHGGIVRGRVSEIIGDRSSGKTTLAASFAAFSTIRGEVAAWIDSAELRSREHGRGGRRPDAVAMGVVASSGASSIGSPLRRNRHL